MGRGRTVVLGRIVKPQGLAGEVRVNLLGGSAEVFERLHQVTLVREGNPVRSLSIESTRVHGRLLVAKFAGVATRSAAESLAGCEVGVPEEELPDLPEGGYYTFQLEGLEVLTESGERLGRLEEVLDFPAHDVYVVRDRGREVMIPATEEVVREIDLEGGRMVVRLLEGLVE